ncbi:hypothetical protein C0991_003198 [Blastosporella zonata]|nr:hypothetical protein C0991_003198 [Blastosporella zonata]
MNPRCPYCAVAKPSIRAVNMHLQAHAPCLKKWQQELTSRHDLPSPPLGPKRKLPPVEIPASDEEYEPEFPDDGTQSKHPRVENVEDEDDPPASQYSRYIHPYPGPAGQWIREGKTKFGALQEWLEQSGKSLWEPFESEEEWELAMWLLKNVGQKSTDEYLKLPIIRNAGNLSFQNNYMFLKKVDALPTGPEWHCEVVTVRGDRLGEDGRFMTEDLELWFRNPVECVKELIGNPAFEKMMAYLPEQVFQDPACQERIYDEMWTGDWWWNLQKLLPGGVTIAPLILSSDKTQLSQFRGDKKAWPVYLTIGNISKELRRQPSAHATILIGYLPAAKLGCFSDATRSLASYRTFHHCMSMILETLVDAGKDGVEMVCADGRVRMVHPILAACLVSATERGSPIRSLLRSTEETLETLQEHKRGQEPPKFEKDGLRAVYQPFWHNLPHCDIFQSFTPDLLHQIHKGVFKDHFVKWCTKIVGAGEVDARFKAMAEYPGLRHFKKGISSVSQWTGTEHKEMEKVMMGVIAGAVDSKVLTVARALLNFIYYAQYQCQTSTTLLALKASLKTFHDYKDIFIELGCREDFNIPKLHSLIHYVETIRAFGSADGYNSESPERLHIDLAKDAYRASNKRDYEEQMALWLQRRQIGWE